MGIGLSIRVRATRGWGVAAALVFVASLGSGCGSSKVTGVPGAGSGGADGGAAGAGAGGADGAAGAGGGMPAGDAGGAEGGAAGSGSDGGDAAETAVGPFAGWHACGSLGTGRDRQVYALSASRDGRRVAVLDTLIGVDHFGQNPNGPQQSVAIWDLPSATLVRRIGDITDGTWALDVDLSPDGTNVAITGDGSRLVRVADGHELWHVMPPATSDPALGIERNFAFSPDGLLLAAGEPDKVEIIAAFTGASMITLTAAPPTPGLAFSPDGKVLASSGAGVWRTAGWTIARPAASQGTIDRFASNVAFVDHWAAFTPDGATILTQSAKSHLEQSKLVWETETQLLDAATGALVEALPADVPRRPTFSPDGRWILAGNQLFDLETRAVRTLAAAPDPSLFLPDGRIVAPLADGSLQLFCPDAP